jgi:hypothetical protein
MSVDRLSKSEEAAHKFIWETKDALYRYALSGNMEKVIHMAHRIEIYEIVYDELYPLVDSDQRKITIPPRHRQDYGN